MNLRSIESDDYPHSSRSVSFKKRAMNFVAVLEGTVCEIQYPLLFYMQTLLTIYYAILAEKKKALEMKYKFKNKLKRWSHII